MAYYGIQKIEMTEEEIIKYSQNVIKFIFDNRIDPKRELITPIIAAWCVYITEEMLVASAFISFVESCWKASFPGYSNITSLADVLKFLTNSAKCAIKSYLNGEIKLIVKMALARNYRTIATGYFNQQADASDAERVYSDADFIPERCIADRLHELGMKNNLR